MDDALAQWLGLRESIDTASRSQSLTRAIVDAIGPQDPVHVLDLATGTGSNLRYLATRLPRNQRWLVVDRSDILLTEMPARTASWGASRGYELARRSTGFSVSGGPSNATLHCDVEIQQRDLGSLESRDVFAGRHLVTASALLDLVSESWLRSLAAHCREAGAAALFTISYDGRSTCTPREPEDDLVLDRFNRHQHTDKGLGGPAAGPDAVAYAVRAFAEAGYRVQSEPSDWTLEPGDRELQRQLIDGWAEAATDISPAEAGVIADWRLRRLRHVDAGTSRIMVGHHDIGAWRPR